MHRMASVPNRRGTKALYVVYTRTPDNEAYLHETRVVNIQTGTSTVFSADVRDREVTWLGADDDIVVWLHDIPGGATEIWVGDVVEGGSSIQNHCAGQIPARATNLKVKRLDNEYDDTAVVVSCPATASGMPYNPEAGLTADGVSVETYNAIWYSTLRKKITESDSQIGYTISPSNFINALRGTNLSSPLSTSDGTSRDFDLSSSGLVFVSRDPHGGGTQHFPSINAYYIPLKTFTEVSRPRPQILTVKDFDGPSSCPVFSPKGSSVALLKKKHPIDVNDRNRVVVINNIREFRAHLRADDIRTAQSEREWHLSPYSVAWSDSGKELYVVAIEQGHRKIFKIPAAVSSIRREPQPITSDSKTEEDVRHLRMVFSAPLETHCLLT